MAEDRAGPALGTGKDDIVVDDENAVAGLRKRLADTTARLEDQRKITNAERTARGAVEREVSNARVATISANELAALNAVQAYEREATNLEAQLEEATTNGSAKDIAPLVRALSSVQTKLDAATNAAAHFKAQREHASKAAPTGAVLAPGEDPRLAPYANFPATKEWIKNHPEFFNDKKFYNKTVAYHQLALEEGHEVDTPEYFRFIEENMGLRKQRSRDDDEFEDPRSEARDVRPSRGSTDPDYSEGDVDPDPRDRRGGTSTAAPTGRRGASADDDDGDRGSNSGRRVTAMDNEGAQISDPELYAKDPRKAIDEYLANKKVLIREGRMGRNATRH